MTAKEEEIIQKLKETINRVVPSGGQVWLYGSRARGDAFPIVA
ncbi:MAG: nucleotidyltransferase domain-containing protein [Bacteroidaceae bacterium]|nr:nucleotidyltransferase domain-containing protein [Bacteroidaceae bacterium]